MAWYSIAISGGCMAVDELIARISPVLARCGIGRLRRMVPPGSLEALATGAYGRRQPNGKTDDGSHEPDDQLATLKNLYPHFRDWGFYFIEDVNEHSRLYQNPRLVKKK
jgi:hypothetical protein